METLEAQIVERGRYAGKYIGRSVMLKCGTTPYRVEALEQLGQDRPFSARLYAPADEITPYQWIKAWITTDTWAEALIAADQLRERILRDLPLGEYESIRRAETAP